MGKLLAIYNSTTAAQAQTVRLLKHLKGGDLTVVDVNGVSAANIVIALDALTDEFEKAIFLCAVTDTGGTAVPSYDAYASVWNLLESTCKGDVIVTGTTAGGSTSTAVLAAGSSASDDTYNDMVIDMTAGTGTDQTKRILDYTGISVTAEVGGAVMTDPSTDTVYTIYDASDYILYVVATDADGKTLIFQTWEALCPTITAPRFIAYLGQYKYAMHAGTAAAGTATTITLNANPDTGIRATTAQIATNDFFNDQWVYIVSGTGLGQYRQITDYVGSTRVATVATWTTNPDNTSVYRVVKDFYEIYNDIAATHVMATFFRGGLADTNNLTEAQKMYNFGQLIDPQTVAIDWAARGTAYALPQDNDYIEEQLNRGKDIFIHSAL